MQVSDPSSADNLDAYSSHGDHSVVTDGHFKANNRSPYFTIERKKKGYITDYRTINQTAINPMLAIDAGLMLTGVVVTVAEGGDGLESSGSSFGPGFIFYGGLGTLLGKKKTFKRKVDLDPMTPVPAHKPEQMHLYVDKVSIKLESGHVDSRNFRSIRNFQSNLTETGEMNERRRVKEHFEVEKIENIDASHELNSMLHEVDFVDTTNTLFRMQKANAVEVEVTKWGYNYIKLGAYSFQLTSKWMMKDNLSKQVLMEGTYVTNSDVIISRSDYDLFRKGFINALSKAMVQFMQEPAFADNMKDKKLKFQSTLDAWSMMTLKGGSYTTQRVGESSRSVATVKTKDGHGSGVFVSQDGYLITNLHVTAAQTTDLDIILADGTKLKGNVERQNPVYDLALVKVDGFQGKPIMVSSQRDIELGETVFAVGTPADLALGQTVTRGIISSKRVFNDLDYIQTDVSVNHGNSGGALLDENGKLIGVVNAKIEGAGVEGVGFAIPSYYFEEALKVQLR